MTGSTFIPTVLGVHARKAHFKLREDRQAFKVVGDIQPVLKERVAENKDKILEMLTGDPLSGPGWEGRKALCLEAEKWLFARVPEERYEPVVRALQGRYEALHEVWMNCPYEEFRAFLKHGYIAVGLEAAKEAA